MADEDKNDIIEEEIIEDEIVEETGLQEKLKKLRVELKACEAQKGEYLAGWQRAKADFINARKDEERVIGEFTKYANESLLRDILAVADSLEIGGKELNPVYAQLQEILKRQGVSAILAKHAKFDPTNHEALGEVDTKNKNEDGMVLEELQKGYIIHNRVLRPSKVKVGIFKN